jgi:hypothetical protein
MLDEVAGTKAVYLYIPSSRFYRRFIWNQSQTSTIG